MNEDQYQNFDSKKKSFHKLIMLGPSYSGRTVLLHRLVTNTFLPRSKGTIGADFQTYDTAYNNQAIRLQFVDTCGQERFQSRSINFYKGADAYLLCVDVTKGDWQSSLDVWREEACQQSGLNNYQLKMILVATKADLPETNDSILQLKEYAKHHQLIGPIFTSAKTGDGIDELLQTTLKVLFIPNIQHYFKDKEALTQSPHFDAHEQLNDAISRNLLTHQSNNTDFLLWFQKAIECTDIGQGKCLLKFGNQQLLMRCITPETLSLINKDYLTKIIYYIETHQNLAACTEELFFAYEQLYKLEKDPHTSIKLLLQLLKWSQQLKQPWPQKFVDKYTTMAIAQSNTDTKLLNLSAKHLHQIGMSLLSCKNINANIGFYYFSLTAQKIMLEKQGAINNDLLTTWIDYGLKDTVSAENLLFLVENLPLTKAQVEQCKYTLTLAYFKIHTHYLEKTEEQDRKKAYLYFEKGFDLSSDFFSLEQRYSLIREFKNSPNIFALGCLKTIMSTYEKNNQYIFIQNDILLFLIQCFIEKPTALNKLVDETLLLKFLDKAKYGLPITSTTMVDNSIIENCIIALVKLENKQIQTKAKLLLASHPKWQLNVSAESFLKEILKDSLDVQTTKDAKQFLAKLICAKNLLNLNESDHTFLQEARAELIELADKNNSLSAMYFLAKQDEATDIVFAWHWYTKLLNHSFYVYLTTPTSAVTNKTSTYIEKAITGLHLCSKKHNWVNTHLYADKELLATLKKICQSSFSTPSATEVYLELTCPKLSSNTYRFIQTKEEAVQVSPTIQFTL